MGAKVGAQVPKRIVQSRHSKLVNPQLPSMQSMTSPAERPPDRAPAAVAVAAAGNQAITAATAPAEAAAAVAAAAAAAGWGPATVAVATATTAALLPKLVILSVLPAWGQASHGVRGSRLNRQLHSCNL